MTQDQSASRNSELKPCPCCGGEARFDENSDGGHYIECNGCGLTTCLVFNLMGGADRELSEVWNRRAAVSERGPIYAGPELTEEELLNLKPGPIQVVYPLDEEWNAALQAALDAYSPDDLAMDWALKINALKRPGDKEDDGRIDLWLDDMRPAPNGWLHVKTVEEAKPYLAAGKVRHASLDHDLGACGACMGGRSIEQWLSESGMTQMPNCDHFGTGYTLVCWMEETGHWPRYCPTVHSANPAGRKRMEQAILRENERTGRWTTA